MSWDPAGKFMVMNKKFLPSSGLGVSVIQRIMRGGNILFVESTVYCPEFCLITRSFSSVLAYLLTPWCRVLFEKLTGLQLVKKFPAFHGT